MYSYQFDNFALDNDRALYENGALCTIPPKELAVLHMLVTHAGDILTKEDLIEQVWYGNAVSDESVTRCIYMLRKILKEKSDNVYIRTIYGRGYCFVKPVIYEGPITAAAEKTAKNMLALFPFKMKDEAESLKVFDFLLQHAERWDDIPDVGFISSALTINCTDMHDAFVVARKAGAQYFITGLEMANGAGRIIRLELVCSATLKILRRCGMSLCADHNINFRHFSLSLQQMINSLIGQEDLPTEGIREPMTATVSKSEVLGALPQIRASDKAGHHCYSAYLTELTGYYFSLAFVGIIAYRQAQHAVNHLYSIAIPMDNDDVLNKPMQILLHHEHARAEYDGDFLTALRLQPTRVDICLLYSVYLLKHNRIEEATRINDLALTLAPGYLAAKIVRMVIASRNNKMSQAVRQGVLLTADNSPANLIVNVFLAVFYHKIGRKNESMRCLQTLSKYRFCALIDYCFQWFDNRAKSDTLQHLYGPFKFKEKNFIHSHFYCLPPYDEKHPN